MKKISIISSCYNENENLNELIDRVFSSLDNIKEYTFEFILIDNKSTDNSKEILENRAKRDTRLKLIFNVRNFGHIRSPYYAMMQATGDAVISLVSDLQDPPELIPEFIKKWEDGYKIVAAIKKSTEEATFFYIIRRFYYKIISKLSDVDLLQNFTGFGLYDKEVINHIRDINDPYPYLRGMISELGYEVSKIHYDQPGRKRGFSKNNLYTLFDMAMLGFTNHTKIPLRLASIIGFLFSVVFFTLGVIYFIMKILFWNIFTLGIAPLVVGIFFIGSIQLFFIGILGEYIGAIYTKVSKRPVVIESKRINFDK